MLLAWQLIQRNVQQAQLRSIALLVGIGIALINLKMPGIAPLCLLLCIGGRARSYASNLAQSILFSRLFSALLLQLK